MKNEFKPVADTKALDNLLALSHEEPVVLFKHSLTCPISAAAYRQMLEVASPVALVVVQRARELSREIAARTGIRHESPQAIIFRHGRAVWNASHYAITAEAVERSVREHA